MFPKSCSNCHSSHNEEQLICPICGHYEIVDLRTFHPTDESMWFVL